MLNIIGDALRITPTRTIVLVVTADRSMSVKVGSATQGVWIMVRLKFQHNAFTWSLVEVDVIKKDVSWGITWMYLKKTNGSWEYTFVSLEKTRGCILRRHQGLLRKHLLLFRIYLDLWRRHLDFLGSRQYYTTILGYRNYCDILRFQGCAL